MNTTVAKKPETAYGKSAEQDVYGTRETNKIDRSDKVESKIDGSIAGPTNPA